MMRPGVGQPIRRLEDKRFVTGAGRYVDNIKSADGTAHAIVVRSPHANADVKALETATARRVGGVLTVLTAVDVLGERIGSLGIRGLPPGFGGASAFLAAATTVGY